MNDLPDSPDLTDAEVLAAIAVAGAPELLAHLREHPCGQCTGGRQTYRHAFRRRAPHHYSRVTVECSCGHRWCFVYRVDWI